MVARTGSYVYDVGVWDLAIVQGPFSVDFCIAVRWRMCFTCAAASSLRSIAACSALFRRTYSDEKLRILT
jgi:hypothetical protein